MEDVQARIEGFIDKYAPETAALFRLTRAPWEGGESPATVEVGFERAGDEVARGVEPAVEVNGREHGLEGVGQQSALAPAARFLLAAPDSQELAEAEPRGGARQSLRAHQTVLHARQLAFGHLRVRAVEHLGDDEAEHRVADELQRLVVEAAGLLLAAGADVLVSPGAVREGALQECAVREDVRECFFERDEVVAVPAGGAARFAVVTVHGGRL